MGKKKIIKDVIFLFAIVAVGIADIVLSVLTVGTFNEGVVKKYSLLFSSVSVAIISVSTILTVVLSQNKKGILYKIFLIAIITALLLLAGLYVLRKSGFFDKIDSVEDLRNYVSSFGSFAVIIFIVLQFSQVVFLPLPSFVTVGAGVLLFGPLKAAIFSSIGIIAGSLVAFYLGRIFGFKVAKWLVGKENLDKGLKAVKGKDKIVLTFMFLFPFFPDDIMCFVAGITTVSPMFFTVMIVITRLISVFISSFSLNNNFIPYTTWWGILIWASFFALTVWLTVLVYKKGDKIEKFFAKKKRTKKVK